MALWNMVFMQLRSEIIPCLCNMDGTWITCCEQHWAGPKAPMLGPSDWAPKEEVLLLTNIILVHEKAAFVHKVCGSNEKIFDNFVHIKGHCDWCNTSHGLSSLYHPLKYSLQQCTCQPIEFSLLKGRSFGVLTFSKGLILLSALGQPIAIRKE